MAAVDLTSNEITLIETWSGSDSSELTTITGCESNINGSEITKSHVSASSSVSEDNESAQTESENLVDTLIKENASLKEQLKSQTLNVHLIEGNDKATNYKKTNTEKLLIAVTSCGVISYMSPYWGGRVSDKNIT